MIKINGNQLTLNQIIKVSQEKENVSLGEDSLQRIISSRQVLEKILNSDIPVYGINTGYGTFANKKITPDDIETLNRNLIISHAVGCGEPLSKEIVRAAMLIRANTLAKGFSGVRVELIQTLIDMLNKGVTPVVKSQGSLGSSGDLCMLAQLALVLSNNATDMDEESGMAEYQGNILTGKNAMRKAKIDRIQLMAKEGLAIINGATFSTAVAALTIMKGIYAIDVANHACALTIEALLGNREPFDPRIQEVRGLDGQKVIAKDILELISGSTFADSGKHIQDPYSIRCVPQIHGAITDTFEYGRVIIEKEINAATDNPLIFGKDIISGGNFHGEPIALIMDFLAIALTELAGVSERRISQLTDATLNHGLPHMLVGTSAETGLNSGMMIPQYTAASLVLENRTLSSPDSIHSLPTSANQEDHNANAMTAARHALQILENTLYVLSIELYVAVRALQIRTHMSPDKELGCKDKIIFDKIDSLMPYRAEDQIWGIEIDRLYEKMKNCELI